MASLLKKIFLENTLLKFFSLLLAISLWFFVMGEKEAEFSFGEVPLELLNKPTDMIITHQSAERFSLRVRGSRGILATLSSSSIKVTVDLEGVKSGMTTFRNLAEKVRLPNGAKVTSMSPNEFSLTMEPLVVKIVPVHLITKGVPQEGYDITHTSVTPEFVEMWVAKSEAEEIGKVVTEPLDISELRGSITREVPLVLTGIAPPRSVSVAKVSVSLSVEERIIEELVSDIGVEVINNSYRVEVLPSTIRVVVKGPYYLVKGISKESISARIDLKGVVPGSYSKKVNITLPEKLTVVEAQPLWCTVVVRKEILSKAAKDQPVSERSGYGRINGEC